MCGTPTAPRPLAGKARGPPEPWLLTRALPWSTDGGVRHLVEGGDQLEQPTTKLGFDPRNSQGERGRVISRCFNVET